MNCRHRQSIERLIYEGIVNFLILSSIGIVSLGFYKIIVGN